MRKLTHYELRVLIKNELTHLKGEHDINAIQARCENIVKYCNEYNHLDEPVYPTPKVTSEHINDAQNYLNPKFRKNYCDKCKAKLNWVENITQYKYIANCCGILYEIPA